MNAASHRLLNSSSTIVSSSFGRSLKMTALHFLENGITSPDLSARRVQHPEHVPLPCSLYRLWPLRERRFVLNLALIGVQFACPSKKQIHLNQLKSPTFSVSPFIEERDPQAPKLPDINCSENATYLGSRSPSGPWLS
jgi:hypothetical protein